MVEVTLIFRYFLLRKLSHIVLDSTQSVLRDMTSQEHCRHPQGMNFKDITKDTIQDMILDTLRFVKKCSIATYMHLHLYEFLAAPPSVVRLKYWCGDRYQSVEQPRVKYTRATETATAHKGRTESETQIY